MSGLIVFVSLRFVYCFVCFLPDNDLTTAWVSDAICGRIMMIGWGWEIFRNFRLAQNQESNNSSIPRPSGRFTSFGSVLNEIHTVSVRGSICWKAKFRKISGPHPPLQGMRGRMIWLREMRLVSGWWMEWMLNGSALRLSDTMRDEKFDKFIKSTKSNAIVHHHVPYCLFNSFVNRNLLVCLLALFIGSPKAWGFCFHCSSALPYLLIAWLFSWSFVLRLSSEGKTTTGGDSSFAVCMFYLLWLSCKSVLISLLLIKDERKCCVLEIFDLI